jgi:RNA polymerase sigma-70 factor (ECF subfamily)
MLMAPRRQGEASARAAEVRAFERAYDDHARGVFGVACRVLGNSQQAEDVVQDVFLGFWRDPSRFDERRGPLGHYLRMCARSRALDMWRESQVAERANDRIKVLLDAEEGPVDARPAVAAERQARSVVVRRALMRLPESQREAIVLTYWGGFTAEEISDSSGTPLGTVKSRIRLGVLKLRAQCAPDLTDLPLAA